jgi:hypothetical protein
MTKLIKLIAAFRNFAKAPKNRDPDVQLHVTERQSFAEN